MPDTDNSEFVKQVAVRLDKEDLDMLKLCASMDKLSDSDVMRRAIRHYHRHLQSVHAGVAS